MARTDITATLGLDDSGYTSKLTAAENAARRMASTTKNEMNGVQGSLDKVSGAAAKTSDGMGRLGNAIIGIGLVGFIAKLGQSANELKDHADGLDVNISRLLEMGVAASGAGGGLDKVTKMMGRMEVVLGQAADGEEVAAEGFVKLGLSIEDLINKTPDHAFNDIALSLSKIKDPAERAAKANDIFGKSFQGINFKQYVDNIVKTYGSMDKYGEAQKKAGDLSEQFAITMDLVRISFTELLSPIMNLINPIGSIEEKMGAASVMAKILAGGVALIVGAGVINAFKSLFTVVTSIAGAFAGQTASTSTTVAAQAMLNSETLAYIRVVGAENIARAQSLTATIAVTRARIAELVSMESSVVVTAELTAAKRALMLAVGQEAIVSANAAGSMAALTVAEGSAAGASVVAATGFKAMTVSMVAALAPIAALSAAAAGLAGTWQATFGEDGIVNGGGGKNFISDMFSGITGTTTRAQDKIAQAVSEMTDTQRAAYGKLSESERNRIDELIVQQNEAQKVSDIFAKMGMGADGNGSTTDTSLADFQAKQQAASEAAMADSKRKKVVALNTAYNAQAAAMNEVLNKTNADNQAALNRIKLQTEIVGLSKADQAAALAGYDAKMKYNNDLYKLEKEIAAFKAKVAEDPEMMAAKGSDAVLAAYDRQLSALKDISAETAALTKAEIERKDVAEMTTYFIEAQKKATDEMKSIEEEMAQLTMTDNEKRLDGVDRMIAKEKELAIAKRQAQLGEGVTIDATEVAAINTKVDQAYAGLKQKTGDLINKSRDFSTGWSRAMKQYVEDTGNAAKKAEKLFTTAFGGMEDSIVGFAKTGKFEWKGFVADMLEQLLRSQIQGVFANLLGSVSGSLNGLTTSTQQSASKDTGIMGAISSLFGGGSQTNGSSSSSIFGGGSQGTPVYVTNWSQAGGSLSSVLGGGTAAAGTAASSGGGIWDSITGAASSVWDGVTGLFGGGSSNPKGYDSGSAYGTTGYGAAPKKKSSSGIWDTITGIGGSLMGGVSDLFSGWFAEGGSIPAGKFGVVGEKGAELAFGPATIVPQGGSGGSSNVTYNINATDAKSFQQLVAADPGFIHAVVMAGGKGFKA